MGQEMTYHEAGKWHPDTIAYDDKNELAKIGKTPDRITQIRIWGSQYIVGMEVFYDNVSAGARMGSEYTKGVYSQDFTLSKGEHIKKIFGRSGDLIDQVGFKTTKGREVTFGTSPGGKKFKLKQEGMVVKGFKVGFGGHLHSIGAFFGPKHGGHKPSPFPTPAPAPFPAPTPGYPSSTPSYPAPTPSYPSSTPSYPAPSPSYPSAPSYPSPGHGSSIPTPGAAQPSQPSWPSAGGSSYPAQPSWPTASGSSATPSYTPPSYNQPTYNPSAPSHSYVPAPSPAASYTPVPAPQPAPHVSYMTQSNVAGKYHGDTKTFDDYKDMLKGKTNIRLTELRVIHDNKFVMGIEALYEADGYSFSGGMHVGSEMSVNTVNQSVSLAWGETITSITGQHGDIIDSLTVKTSTGKIYKFGGTGGSFTYSLYIPDGKTVKAFAGGVGGHLHNISCYYE